MKPIAALKMRNAAAVSGHLYWRIFCTNNHGDVTGIVIAEIEMRATTSGADQCTGGTAIGSDDATGNEFSKAFDNNVSTEWFANASPTNQWIGYHFASPVDVQEVALTMSNLGSQTSLNRMPKDCSLDYSDDGVTWTTSFSFNVYCHNHAQTRTFPDAGAAAGFHRAWRINISAINGGARVNLDELDFRATAGGADQTTVQTSDAGNTGGRQLVSTEIGGGNEKYRLFNNVTNTGNYWESSGNVPQTAGYVFVTPVQVVELSMTSANAQASTKAPKDFTVEYSDDEVTWTVQKTITGQTWTNNETKVLAAI